MEDTPDSREQEARRELESEQVARAQAERAASRASFVVEATELLAASLDYETTLQQLADLAVATLADWCVVHIEDGASLRALAVAHADPRKGAIARELEQRFPRGESGAVSRVFQSGSPELVESIPNARLSAVATSPEHLALLKQLDLGSAMLVPLIARGHTLGVITFVTESSARHYDWDDLELVQQLARHAALAVDNARLYREARNAARARDEVIAIVSHDLRNPLNIVSMAAELLADPDLPEESRRDTVERLDRAVRRMGQLIRDLLDVTRLDSGAMPLERQRLEPATPMREAVQLMEPLAENKQIQLQSTAEEGLPELEADQARLVQIFSNLLGNAIKFTPAGGRIDVRAEPAEGGVRYSVRDTGPGIAREHQPHLFDRFYQAQRTGRQGAGLGLAIAKGLVEAHGGSIGFESELGSGTIFFFTIPAR